MEEGRFALHDRLVDWRNLDQRPTLDGQMEPGTVVAEAGRPIGKHHTALVPAGVRFTDWGEIYGRGVVMGIVIGDEVDASDEKVFGGEDGIVEGERLQALKPNLHCDN